MRSIGLVIALTGVAAAAPGKVPTTPVPCLPKNETYRIAAAGTEPVVCAGATCMKRVDPDSAALVDPPPVRPAWIDPRPEIRDGKVCLGQDCKPLGPKLTKAIKDHAEVTSDRKAVVVDHDLWSVARDAPIALHPPAKDRGTPPAIEGIQLAGNLALVDWLDCGGMCVSAQLVDSSGANRGKPIGGRHLVVQLDAKRFAAINEGEVDVFDVAGKLLGTAAINAIQPGDDNPSYSAVRLGDDGDLAILTTDQHAYRMTVMSTPAGKSPYITSEWFLPVCR